MPSLSLRAALALGLTAAAGAAALACENTAGPAEAKNAPAISADVAPAPAPDGAFIGNLDHGIKIMTHPQRPVKVVSANVYIDGDGDGLVAGKPAKSFVDWHTHPGPTMVIVTGGTLTMHHASDCNHTETYPAGSVFFAPEGIHLASNDSGTDIILRGTFFLPEGAAPTVFEPAEFTACGL
ncbi:MAG TPA: hypothetical protein VFO96_12145 [Gemmatimonadales bacterium]|jgi:hypothetical protein|nr:hypothetical protein [Gemmatimonadales bacterium]